MYTVAMNSGELVGLYRKRAWILSGRSYMHLPLSYTACLACCSPTAATRSRQATVQRSFATNRDGSSRPCG